MLEDGPSANQGGRADGKWRLSVAANHMLKTDFTSSGGSGLKPKDKHCGEKVMERCFFFWGVWFVVLGASTGAGVGVVVMVVGWGVLGFSLSQIVFPLLRVCVCPCPSTGVIIFH